MSEYVIEEGGEVEVNHRDETLLYDRIVFTNSGMVVCINKQMYAKDCYPREEIESVRTHTSDEEEDAGWW